ncbi:Alpha/Beta hydrolase protein [Nemania sp. FL0031]|nr:Alpha/Beta hydrolase protein [Nemania sp. FL0031]
MASKLSFSGDVQGPNGRLFVEREGNPNGQSILFVHGLGGTTNSYQTLVLALQEFDLIRFDLSGHGRSAVPRSTSIHSYMEDCEAIISHFRLESFIVVGHSLGGLVSLHLAARALHTIKALVLFGPVFPPPVAGQTALEGRVAAVRQGGMAAIADIVISNAFAPESLVKRLGEVALAREMLTRQNPEGYALAVEALKKSMVPKLKCIGAPTKVVTGEKDKVSTVETGRFFIDNIGKHAEQIILPGVGHWHTLEALAQCIEIIKGVAMGCE